MLVVVDIKGQGRNRNLITVVPDGRLEGGGRETRGEKRGGSALSARFQIPVEYRTTIESRGTAVFASNFNLFLPRLPSQYHISRSMSVCLPASLATRHHYSTQSTILA